MNENEIDWSKLNNNYLIKVKIYITKKMFFYCLKFIIIFQTNYDEAFLLNAYNKTTELTFDKYKQLKQEYSKNQTSILLTYTSKDEFIKYAKYFGIMSDFKAGVPRTAYKGVVRIYSDQCLIYIAPSLKYAWTNYPKDW